MQPEDLVGAVLFLVSDGAAYIIGPAINVNCGTVMI
jgi:NAD(P)-dependent dehydrogenase (short-subunit alcohol dehydrogenase family)